MKNPFGKHIDLTNYVIHHESLELSESNNDAPGSSLEPTTFFHPRLDQTSSSKQPYRVEAATMPQMNNVGGCTLDTCTLSMATVHYDPSLVANSFFLSNILRRHLLIQAIQAWQFRAWSYSMSIMSGLVLEIVGYVGRVQMHFNPFNPNPFLM
jgi:hypothetical protein